MLTVPARFPQPLEEALGSNQLLLLLLRLPAGVDDDGSNLRNSVLATRPRSLEATPESGSLALSSPVC